jgi:hypothetical protein
VSTPADDSSTTGLDRFSDIPAVLATVWMAGLLAYTIAGRLTFPYDLEWMEGGMLVHAWRVLQGEPLYVVPTSDFVPFIYPPLYHWVVAAVGGVFGFGYPAARAVSVVGTFATAGFAVWAARTEGVRWGLAIAAAGLYLSAFEDTGGFFDLARLDGLFMALTTGALVAGRHRAWPAAGLLLTLAFATKHNAALFGLPILLWAFREQGRAGALRFALWSVVPALTFTVLVTALEGDQLFLTYILGVPSKHGFVAQRFFWLAQQEELLALPFTTVLLAAYGAIWWRDRKTNPTPLSSGARYWLWNGALAVLLSAMMRGHQGGYSNVLMPAIWALSVGGVVALEHLRTRFPKRALVFGLPLLVAGQLAYEDWDPDNHRASESDWEAGALLVEAVAEQEGEVLAPWSPWISVQAGKSPGFHLIGLWDINHAGGPLVEHVAGITQDIEDHRWQSVLVMSERNMPTGLKRSYKKGERVVSSGPTLRPKTGWRVSPRNFWHPKTEPDRKPKTDL